MIIYPLTEAVRLLDEAASLTPDNVERGTIEVAARVMRKLLQRRGVFIGGPKRNHPLPSPEVTEDEGVPWCNACQSWHDKPKDAAHKALLQCRAR